MNPKLIIEQKITVFANKYLIYAAQADGTKGELLALAQQKRMAVKEKVTFYNDESKSQAVFSFRAEKVLDVHGRYIVEDEKGQEIGSFKKEFAQSLINSTWSILNREGKPLIKVSESSMPLAVLRRFGGAIPLVGPVAEIITSLLRYHFEFKVLATNELVGKYQKTKLFRDHYLLSMNDDIYDKTDWRVFASMAIALDALQSR